MICIADACTADKRYNCRDMMREGLKRKARSGAIRRHEDLQCKARPAGHAQKIKIVIRMNKQLVNFTCDHE